MWVRGPLTPLAFREIGYGYIPGQTFCASVVGHLFVVIMILLLHNGASFKRPLTLAKPQTANRRRVSVYLPILGGGTGGRGQTHRSKGKIGKNAGRLLAQSGSGFAYPGPQPIISNPPEATLGKQTILRGMRNLPLFEHDLPLPNLVRPPSPVKDEHSKPLVVKSRSSSPAEQHPTEKVVTAPKIQLPARTAHDMIPALAESRPALP